MSFALISATGRATLIFFKSHNFRSGNTSNVAVNSRSLPFLSSRISTFGCPTGFSFSFDIASAKPVLIASPTISWRIPRPKCCWTTLTGTFPFLKPLRATVFAAFCNLSETFASILEDRITIFSVVSNPWVDSIDTFIKILLIKNGTRGET